MTINGPKDAGFSLIELSIVVVIIAILIGAVVQGRGMIENAKLRTIISEVSEHRVSLNSFYAKYNKFPGDFDEAVAYWGGTTTDGDNDGQIEFVTGGVYEGYRAWQHLSYAKMINVALVGTETTGAAVLETDIPKSIHKGGYFLEYAVFGLTDANVLVLGGPVATSSAPILVSGIFTISQAHKIDNKSDDGEPSTGSVRGKDGNGAAAESCVDDPSDDGPNSEDFYKPIAPGDNCTLGFKMTGQ